MKSENKGQNKCFEDLELQSSTLSEQHEQLAELANKVHDRAEQADKNVGQ